MSTNDFNYRSQLIIATNHILTADLSRWSQQLISTDELNRLVGKLVDWIISLSSQPQPPSPQTPYHTTCGLIGILSNSFFTKMMNWKWYILHYWTAHRLWYEFHIYQKTWNTNLVNPPYLDRNLFFWKFVAPPKKDKFFSERFQRFFGGGFLVF